MKHQDEDRAVHALIGAGKALQRPRDESLADLQLICGSDIVDADGKALLADEPSTQLGQPVHDPGSCPC